MGIKSKDAGIADNGDEVGIYATNMKTRDVVYLLDPRSAPGVIKQLGQKVKANYCLVYTDTFKNEGPFIGSPSPIQGTSIVMPFKEALIEFVRQVTLPAHLKTAPKSGAVSDEYLMTLVESQAELKREVASAAKRLGIKAKVESMREDNSGIGWLATISFGSKADKEKYDAEYYEGMDD